MQSSHHPFDRQLSLALDRFILRLEARPRPLRRALLRKQKNLLERRIPSQKVRYATSR
jgi:hypothetical protein